MKLLPALLALLLLPCTAQAFTLDNSTLIMPTQSNITYKIADYKALSRLVVEAGHIEIGAETLEAAAQNSLTLIVLEFGRLDRDFLLINSTPNENLTINMTGLPNSVTMALYANSTLLTTVTTNATGGLNYRFTDFTGYVTLFSLQHYEAPPPPGGGEGGSEGGFPEDPTTIPPQASCNFSVTPRKLVGTGIPGEVVYPPFTVYITNPYAAQNFTIAFDDMMSYNCFIDYSNSPNTGEVQAGETVAYIIGCMAPASAQAGNMTISSSLGCTKTIIAELQPTEGIMTEINIAFEKMSFGDIEGFLASKILGISVIIWIVIALLVVIIMILVLSTLVLGGR